MARMVFALVLILILQFSVKAGYTVPLSHAEEYEGDVVGSGECAAGVQEVFYDHYGSWVLGLTSTWEKGEKVVGNSVAPGTAIACFRYSNSYSAGHAAILISYESDGILVWDQWSGQSWHQRTIEDRSGSSFDVNDANCYYVIEN